MVLCPLWQVCESKMNITITLNHLPPLKNWRRIHVGFTSDQDALISGSMMLISTMIKMFPLIVLSLRLPIAFSSNVPRSIKICAQRKAGRWKPSHCPLRFVTSRSRVARVSLAFRALFNAKKGSARGGGGRFIGYCSQNMNSSKPLTDPLRSIVGQDALLSHINPIELLGLPVILPHPVWWSGHTCMKRRVGWG